MSIWNEIKDSYRHGTVLTRLIYINLAVFVTLRLIQTINTLVNGAMPGSEEILLSWISVPYSPHELLTKPWTLITYMFVHYNFLHILFNILYLYWFGKIFLEFLSSRQLLAVYILGGLAGAFLSITAYNLIPVLYQKVPSSFLLGASASVMAILFAVSIVKPNHSLYLMFLGEVKLKYLALGAFIIDIISIPTLDNTGGHFAHFGGALMGLFYGWLLLKGTDLAKPIALFKVPSFNPFKRKSKLSVTHKRPMTDLEYNAQKVRKQKEVDRILDKIKVSGYDSLSKDEKTILFEASKD